MYIKNIKKKLNFIRITGWLQRGSFFIRPLSAGMYYGVAFNVFSMVTDIQKID